MKLMILKMSKKQAFAVFFAVMIFAGSGLIGAQVYANAGGNTVAVLPIAKGGTNANNAITASGNILGANFANYSGLLPTSKGGTGLTSAVSTSISSSSTNSQIPTALSVYNRVPRVQYGTVNKQMNANTGWTSVKVTGLTGFNSAPKVFMQKRSTSSSNYPYTKMDWNILATTTSQFTFSCWNDSTTTAMTADFDWVAIGW
jgi:hypothetical protein